MRNRHWKGSNYIPEEILVDILVRLPVKSLLRFRCVCKSWNGLIGSSSFIGTHLNRNVTKHAHNFLFASHCRTRGKRNNCHSLFFNETFKECLEIRRPLGMNKIFGIYGCCNGLVCLSEQRVRLKSRICIYNPSIRKHVILPLTTISLRRFSPYANVLAFGFHPGLNDYKVVRMVSYDGKKCYIEVEVYSLSTESWKRIDVIPPLIKTMCWYSGYAICGGVAYWLMRNDNHTLYLVSFDTASEVFEELLLPDSLKGYPSITEYKESIFLFQRNLFEQEFPVDIWVLQQKSFKKLYTVVLPGKILTPLNFRMNNELLIRYPEKRFDGSVNLALYDLESKQVTETGIRLNPYYEYFADTYTESLVLLQH